MGNEPKPEAIGEGGHFRDGDHFAAGAAQHYDMGVVDHHPACRTPEKAMCVGQKHFAVEALERRKELEKEHA